MATDTRPRLRAQPREASHRKSARRALRKAGLVPASIFGHGEPELIHLSARELSDHLHAHAPSAITDVELGGRTTCAVLREVDRDPVSGHVIHIGFQRVDLTERIRADVPVVIQGEEELIRNGLVLERQLDSLHVHGPASDIPESVMVDLTDAQAGHLVHVSDLKLPGSVHCDQDASLVLARVSTPTVAADVAAALDAEEAAHAAVLEERAEEGSDEEQESEPEAVGAVEAE